KSSRNGYMLSSTVIVMVSASLVVACDAAEFPQQGPTQPSESVCPQIREIARFRARIPAKGLPVIGWLLNLVYAALLVALSPVLAWRMMGQGKYRDGWSEKFAGRLPRTADDEQGVWLHAVSVGEVLQLRALVPGLRRESPELTILITTTTLT